MDDLQWPTADELAPWLKGKEAVVAFIRANDTQKRREAERAHYERIQKAREEEGV